MIYDPVITAESESLFDLVRGYLPSDKLKLVEDSYLFATECHRGQFRRSGGPYLEHPLQAAISLAQLHLDGVTIAASLLHDVIEDCGVEYMDLKHRFGEDVANLVNGVTKLNQMDLVLKNGDGTSLGFQKTQLQAESLRKMLVAMAQDVRVILIKLADRLHNMRTLGSLPPQRRKAIAKETLDIYTPLAHRLGIGDFKWRLEDMAFRYLDNRKYRQISRMLAVKRNEREKYIFEVIRSLETQLEESDIKSQVSGRPKNIYSIFQKMQKYALQGKQLSQIHDLYALRVLVQTPADCYSALGIVHGLWRPVPGQFDDYIANSKENLYKSLHTTVMCDGGTPLEVQIRTYDMHEVAEHGVAAHWRYKDVDSIDSPHSEDKMSWMRQLLEWQQEVSGAEEFLESVKSDIFPDQVFVYTPKGDVVEMPVGATPIDFAYKIHTELGHRCIGAKINGLLMSLETELRNGDTVEVIASRVNRGPSLDWLNSELAYFRSASTREKVRQWFRRQERETILNHGRDLLKTEIRRLNLPIDETEVAKVLRYDSIDDALAAIGFGTITRSQLIEALTGEINYVDDTNKRTLTNKVGGFASNVAILGVGDLSVRMDMCCHPIPGDEILGHVTREKYVIVHRADCQELLDHAEYADSLELQWGPNSSVYTVQIEVKASDRVGLLRDITTAVSGESVNIEYVMTEKRSDGEVYTSLTLKTTGIVQLSRVFTKLESIHGIVSVTRSRPFTPINEINFENEGEHSA